jgi:hypothetical protein
VAQFGTAHLVTRSELARRAGVSPTAITKACRRSLAGAVRGKKVDLDHPAVREYLSKHAAGSTPARPAPPLRAVVAGRRAVRGGPTPPAPSRRVVVAGRLRREAERAAVRERGS